MTAHVLLVDNYDSFTFNLVQALATLGAEVTVRRNDEVEPDDLEGMSHLCISPGPGHPAADSAGARRALGNGHGIEDMLAKLRGRSVRRIARRLQSVARDGSEYGLDIIRVNAGVMLDEGMRFRRGDQRECAAGRQANVDVG